MVFSSSGSCAHNQVTVTNAATLVRAAAADRANCCVRNIGAADCYLGTSAAVTASSGFLLTSAGKDALDVHWTGTIYAITASGSTTLAYFEELT